MSKLDDYKGGVLAAFLYSVVLISSFIAFGGVLVHEGNILEGLSQQGTAYVKQLTHDWEQKPYTDIQVVSQTWCD